MPETNSDDIRMSFGDHLEELRWRILLGLIGPVLASIGALFFGKKLVAILCQPLLLALARLGLTPQVHNFTVASAFAVYLKVSLITGLIIGLPWLLWQLWKFIEAGLYPTERHFVRALIPGSVLLTLTGVAFMYFIMLPITLTFLIAFTASFPAPALEGNAWFNWLYDRLTPTYSTPEIPEPGAAPELALTTDPPAIMKLPMVNSDPESPVPGQAWLKLPEHQLRIFLDGEIRSITLATPTLMSPFLQVDEYISFVLWMALAFAISFQLPLVMLLLAKIGLVDLGFLQATRKYAILICFIVGAILTPADPLSQITLALPLWGLYEFGIWLVRVLVRRPEVPAE